MRISSAPETRVLHDLSRPLLFSDEVEDPLHKLVPVYSRGGYRALEESNGYVCDARAYLSAITCVVEERRQDLWMFTLECENGLRTPRIASISLPKVIRIERTWALEEDLVVVKERLS